MKTFSAVPRDDRYRAEQARHLDSPFRLAVFESVWSGTEQLQAQIARDGASHWQQQLGAIRVEIARLDSEIPLFEKVGQQADAKAITASTRARNLAKAYDSYRDPSTGRRVPKDNSRKVAALANQATTEDRFAKLCGREVAQRRKTLPTLRDADERLAVALALYLERSAVKAAEPPPPPPAPPVVNVTVQPAELNLEARIEMPAPEVTVSLPNRRIIGTIERDRNGNIVSTEQLETTVEE
jgi:hypothetical protein